MRLLPPLLLAAAQSTCTDPAASNYVAGKPPAFDACTYDCASLKAAMSDLDRGASFADATCYIWDATDGWGALPTGAGTPPNDKKAEVPTGTSWIVQGHTNAANVSELLAVKFAVTVGASLAVRHANVHPGVGVQSANGGAFEVTGGAVRLESVTAVDPTEGQEIQAARGGFLYGSGATVDIAASTIQTRAPRGGGLYVEADTNVVIRDGTVFKGCKSSASGGGGILAKGSSVNISDSTFRHNIYDGQDPPEHGAQMYLEASSAAGGVRIVNTIITPATVQTAVNVTPVADLLTFVELCRDTQNPPCQPGHGCSWHDFSAWCTQCDDDHISPHGATCTPCEAGKQPNADQSNCVGCPPGLYSGSGKCRECPAGSQPTSNQQDCGSAYHCDPGYECPLKTCYVVAECTSCTAHHYATGDGNNCTLCNTDANSPFVVDGATRSKCEPCKAGEGPNDDRTGCVPCAQKGVSNDTYSTYGVCLACDQGKVPNADRSACQIPSQCTPGKTCNQKECGPDQCENCTIGRYNSDGGTCLECKTSTNPGYAVQNNINNGLPTNCGPCSAGFGAKPDGSGCETCPLGEYSNFQQGVSTCQNCTFPDILLNARGDGPGNELCRTCETGKGPTGRTYQRTCEECQGNEIAESGQCKQCGEGKLTKEGHTACGSCPTHQSYVDGVSNVTGKCACSSTGGTRGQGYYDASRALIICLTDGYDEPLVEDEYTLYFHRDPAGGSCQECPPCANCSTGNWIHNDGISHFVYDGIPQINDGYNAFSNPELDHVHDNQPNWDTPLSPADSGQKFQFAFLCDVSSALTPNATEYFSYRTTDLANARCKGQKWLNDTTPSAKKMAKDKCETGYEGYFCESCIGKDSEGDNPPYHHDSQNLCVKCPKDKKRYWIIPLVTIPILVLLGLGYKKLKWDSAGLKAAKATVSKVFFICKSPAKTVVTYMQVTGQLSAVLHTTYPEMFQQVIALFRPFKEGFAAFFNSDCVGLPGFENKWLMRVAGLPTIAVCLAVVELIVRYCSAKRKSNERERDNKIQKAKESFFGRLLFFIFLTYPTINNIAFSALNCQLVSPGVRVLVDDDRIVCSDDDDLTGDRGSFDHWKWASWGVIAFFGCGFPLFIIASVVSKTWNTDDAVDPQALDGGDEADEARHLNTVSKRAADELGISPDRAAAVNKEVTELSSFTSLTESYNPKYPWWEAVDVLRKLSLVGFVVLVGRGSVAQIAFANFLSFCFFAAHMNIFPMKTRWDNCLRASAEVHVFWVITIAFVMKNDLTHEVKPFGATWHGEQFWPDFYGLLLTVSAIICIPVGFCFTILLKWRDVNKAMAIAEDNESAGEVDYSICCFNGAWLRKCCCSRCKRCCKVSGENEQLKLLRKNREKYMHDTDDCKLLSKKAREAYAHFKHGLTSDDDRENLKHYFEELKRPRTARSTIMRISIFIDAPGPGSSMEEMGPDTDEAPPAKKNKKKAGGGLSEGLLAGADSEPSTARSSASAPPRHPSEQPASAPEPAAAAPTPAQGGSRPASPERGEAQGAI